VCDDANVPTKGRLVVVSAGEEKNLVMDRVFSAECLSPNDGLVLEYNVVRVGARHLVRPLIHSLVGKAEEGSGPTTRRAYAVLAVLHALPAVLHVLALPHDGVGGFALTESHGDTNQFIT
jgi:hypothetical protein